MGSPKPSLCRISIFADLPEAVDRADVVIESVLENAVERELILNRGNRLIPFVGSSDVQAHRAADHHGPDTDTQIGFPDRC